MRQRASALLALLAASPSGAAAAAAPAPARARSAARGVALAAAFGRGAPPPIALRVPSFRLPSRSALRVAEDGGEGGGPRRRRSVTGVIYSAADGRTDGDDRDRADLSRPYPVVTLYTKEGCTLCDAVVDVLRSVRYTHPHTLEAVDITDPEHAPWYSKYKWDIPVLRIDGTYWAKHGMTEEEAREGLDEAGAGTFRERPGEPDAEEVERRREEREGGGGVSGS